MCVCVFLHQLPTTSICHFLFPPSPSSVIKCAEVHEEINEVWQCSINVYCTAGHIELWTVRYRSLRHRTQDSGWPHITWTWCITTGGGVGFSLAYFSVWSSPPPHYDRGWNWAPCRRLWESYRALIVCVCLLSCLLGIKETSTWVNLSLCPSLDRSPPPPPPHSQTDDLQHISVRQQLLWCNDRVSHESTSAVPLGITQREVERGKGQWGRG